MKLRHIIALALCLKVPMAHAGNDFECSPGAYVGSTLLACSGALLTAGSYIAYQEAIRVSKKEATVCKGLLMFSSLLSAGGTYCLTSCIIK